MKLTVLLVLLGAFLNVGCASMDSHREPEEVHHRMDYEPRGMRFNP